MRKYRFNKKDGTKSMLIIFLMITIGAVIIGYFGTRYFLYPIFIKGTTAEVTGIEENQNQDTATQSNNSVQNSTVSEESEEPEEKRHTFYIYHVQMGNFSSEKNAELLIDSLEENDIYAYVLKENGLKVVTAPLADYGQAEVLKNNLLTYAKDAFILKRQVQVENTSVQTTITNILNDLNEARSQPDSSRWINILKDAFQDGLGDSQMEQETLQVFQNIYDEVNQIDTSENNLFDIEKNIIIMIEEIIS